MKKLFYTLALVSIALTACHKKPSYTISGTVEKGVENGQKVFLLNACSTYPYKIADSAVVNDCKFTFTGRQDVPQIYVLQVPTSTIGKKIIPFILENGHIVIDTEKEFIAGTMINNAFQAHKDSIKSYEAEYMETIKKLQNDSSLTAEQKEMRKETEMRQRVEKEMALFRKAITETIHLNDSTQINNTNTNNPINNIYMRIIAMDSIQNR